MTPGMSNLTPPTLYDRDTTPAAATAAVPVSHLLKHFAKQPSCDKYAADSEKINLLTEYFWLRQLTPNLPFETFLSLFTALADHDDENLKHPSNAIRALCPRTQASATKYNRAMWTAKQLVGCLSLYVDVIREAEALGQAVTMDLKTFLNLIGPRYLAGEFDEKPKAAAPAPAPAPAAPPAVVPLPVSPTPPIVGDVAFVPPAAPVESPAAISIPFARLPESLVIDPNVPPIATAPPPPAAPEPRKRRQAGAPATAPPTAPALAVGLPVIYTHPSGRQWHGHVHEVHNDPQTQRCYVDFLSSDGELHEGLAAASVRPTTEADGPFPAPSTAPMVASTTLNIPRARYANLAKVLQMAQPVGTVNVGDPIEPMNTVFGSPPVTAYFDVMNGENGPYVDAFLRDGNDQLIAELPPRKVLLGRYHFVTAAGAYVVDLSARGVETPQ